MLVNLSDSGHVCPLLIIHFLTTFAPARPLEYQCSFLHPFNLALFTWAPLNHAVV